MSFIARKLAFQRSELYTLQGFDLQVEEVAGRQKGFSKISCDHKKTPVTCPGSGTSDRQENWFLARPHA